MTKRILITGGAGFIGSNLTGRLLEENHEVIVIDNFITSSQRNITNFLGNPRYIFINHDITRRFTQSQKKLLKNIDEIYHLACPTGVPNLIPLAEEVILTCTIGTRNILELAKEEDVSLVFTSSSEVYGNPKVSPQTEEYVGNVSTLGERSVYEEGKRVAETMIQMYVRKYDLDAKIIRVFNTYGPQMDRSDTRVIPNFMSKLSMNQPLLIQGEGIQTRTFCYVDDLVEGLLLVMEKGEQGAVYNLGSDDEISVYELAKLLLSLSPQGGKTVSVDRPHHDHDMRHPDLTKVRKLGWNPVVSLAQGLKQTMVWYGL